MKKPNLSLKTRPIKKVSDDLNTEVKHFHELITKVVKKNPLQYEQPLLDALEAELAKCKDGIETWIKANALEQLGYTDFASKFKEKATELGYSVDRVMEGKSEFSRQLLNIKMILKNLMKHSEGNSEVVTALNQTIKQVENLNVLMFKKLVNENSIVGKKIKLILIKENVENIESGEQGTVTNHDTEADIISVKWDNGKESTILPEDEFEVLGETFSVGPEGLNTGTDTKIAVKRLINSVWTLVYKQIDEKNIEVISYDRENPIGIEKERELPLCELVEDENRTVIGAKIQERNKTGFNSGWVDKDRPFDTLTVTNPKHIFSYEGTTSTNENLVLNPEQGKNQMMLQDTTTLNNGEPTSATKQEIEGVPEYNKSALVSLILSDPFLSYSFHATTTDDQDADLEKFYKHYIKGDEKMERMLDVYTQNVAPKHKNLKPFNGANSDTK